MPFPKIVILLLLSGLSAVAGAQRCGYTDTIDISNQGLTSLTIDIDGYLNNSLAAGNQGLCGVSVYFQHSYVYDFTLTVTSPAGQSVDLVGPINAQTRPPTNLARWFVNFNRCLLAPQPDFRAPGRWNNNAPFNWAAFGRYQGTYHPARGCLEDFNSGPVNGNWTIGFNTARQGQQARVTYLLLEFCDDSNVDGPCCNAYAGNLNPIPNLEFCEETASLPLPLVPRFSRPRADRNQYDYTYVVARDGAIIATQDNPDLGNLPAGLYEICGLSYRNGELANLPVDGSLSVSALRTDLAGIDPTLCGDLTPVCQTVNLYPIPPTTFISRVRCRNGPAVRLGDTDYFTDNTHTATLVGRAGCDSVVVLDLTVVDEFFTALDTTICAEGVYRQGNNQYTRPGVFRDTVASVDGCDSILQVRLAFAPAIVKDTVTAICAGDRFMIGNEAITEEGRYERRISAVNGCDSLVRLNLLVIDPIIRIADHPDALSCDDPTIELNAAGSTFSFLNRGVWTDVNGTDLSFFRRFTVDSAGTYYYELTNQTQGVGCTVRDTIIIADNRSTIAANLALPQVPCDGLEEPCGFLSCRNPTLTIVASPTPATTVYRYEWTAPAGGNILGSTTASQITVDQPGTYLVRIENDATGCFTVDSLQIGRDTVQPRAAISGPLLLNCDFPSLELVADTLQANADSLDYVWSGSCLAEPVRGARLRVDCPGRLTLTITNRVNGCQDVSSVNVQRDFAPSQISLAPATAPLSCYEPSRLLDASGSSSANGQLFYWTYESAADTIGRADRLTATRAGRYYLTAVDRRSGCRARDSITVPADTLAPVAVSGPDTVAIDCYTPSQILGDPATSSGPFYRYAWVEVNALADTISRDRRLVASPAGGLYRFSVLDVRNGCVSTDLTRVRSRLDTPRIVITEPLQFECFIDSVALDASRTDLDFERVTRWSGPCLPEAPDSSFLYAYCPGTYYFDVLNVETGCQRRDSVRLLLGENSVVARLPDTTFLDCDSGTARLDRRQGTDAPVVRWFRDGEPVNLVGQQPRVTVPGVYTLVLGNFNEDCLDTARTIVTANCPALAIIVPPDSLTCARAVVELDATVSFPGISGSVTTEWLIPDGAITRPGASERELLVFSPGSYGFVVFNTVSLDRDTTFVTVRQNVLPPVAFAGERDTVTCYEPVVTLSGAGSSEGPLYDYRWSNSGNAEISTELSTEVTSGGVYLFEVIQRETGCSDIDNVRVITDKDPPKINFTSAVIPCDTVDFALAVLPVEEDAYAYAWTGPNVLAGSLTDTLRISDVGTYNVVVTRLDNGCSVVDSTVATRLPCPPFPRLADTSLSCVETSVLLTSAFRDTCQGCTYTWRRDGEIIPGETETSLRVSSPGRYAIVAINQFGLVGSDTATVSDSRFVPEDNAGPDQTLTCLTTEALLWNPAAEPPYAFRYQWFGPDGNPIAGAAADSLRVSRGGRYQLASTNLFSNCTIVDTVLVNYDTVAPVVDAGSPRLLDCDNKRRVLDGLNSSLGRAFVYDWTGGPSVACLEGRNTLNPLVRCGGEYTLTVRDTLNGCAASAGVTVFVDEALPVVIPLPDTSVDCGNRTVRLIGQDIDRPDVAYGWQRVVPGEDEAVGEVAPGVIEVGEAGLFRFFIRDTLNGCDNEFEVAVTADLEIPELSVSEADTFFCELDSLQLLGTVRGTAPEVLTYSWVSETGFFIGAAATRLATIFQPDTYYLTALNTANRCLATDSVTIFRDVRAPVADAGRDTTLTCARREVSLQGSGTSNSGELIYGWSTMNGRLVSGLTTPQPTVAATGTYLFTLTDPQNGCSGADIVRVREDTLRPRATILANEGLLLNCNRPRLRLNAQVRGANGTAVDRQWQAPPGDTLTGPADAAFLPVIASGRYRLLAISRENGCRDTATVVVAEDFVPPSVSVPLPATLSCNRDSVALVVDNASDLPVFRYRWLDDQNSLLARDERLFVRARGDYRVITQSLVNGCRDTTRTRVTGDFERPSVFVAPPLTLNCFRAEASINGTASDGGPEFFAEWRGPQGGITATDDPYLVRGRQPGLYYLTVTDLTNGCVTTDSTELIREATLIEDFTFAVDQPACVEDRDGAVTITGVNGGTAPFRYRLDGGLLTDRLTYDGLPLGAYELEVIGADGCNERATFTINEATRPTVRLREDTIIDLGDTLLLDFVTSFNDFDTLLWTSSGPLPDSLGNGPIRVSPLQSQTYRLVVQDNEGCRATASVVVEVNGQVNVYVPSAFSPNGDQANELMRPYAGPQVRSIDAFRIFDRWGELLYDLKTDPGRTGDRFGWDGRLNGRLLNPQVFVWELRATLIDGAKVQQFGDFILMR